MATDSQQLTVPPGNPGTRTSALLGLAVLLPLVTWSAAVGMTTLASGVAVEFAHQALRTVLLVQLLSLCLFTPWFAQLDEWQQGLAGILGIAFVTLPLLALLWLASPVAASLLLTAQVVAGLFAGGLFLIFRVLHGILKGDLARQLLMPALSLACACLVWISHPGWLTGFGL